MFFPDGKLEQKPLGLPGGDTKVINRLNLSCLTSKSKYLINTGADDSVVPLTAESKHRPPASFQLFAANENTISTYGQRLLALDFGLQTVFQWSFIISAISQPIIGADFLRHYGLLVDIRKEFLVDSFTKLQTQGTVQQGNNSGVKEVNDNTTFHRLIAEFPSLLKVVSTRRQLKHEGISPIPEKVEAITNFPKPQTVKKLRRFLAIYNFYSRFISHAARPQKRLNSYLKGDKRNDRTPILWSEDSTAAFEKCKKDLAGITALYHLAADALLAIVVDVSDTAVGAALHQQAQITLSVDRLKPAYVPKELVDFPAGVHRTEKVYSQPEEVRGLGQEKPTESYSSGGYLCRAAVAERIQQE
ncbi:retrovirus-related Pol polyprotein from transposon 297 [Nephila pilipes]|uniref:Retrovirus-related Pol polyprotein from transposon 297 n=1 Tax=Nephila pilipes TaxID=299642 RepID=A0A8X6NWD9_NEPPI|nr:retrovirus-related Pol polyprotein from transposon 297 [Nephila pilipes]